MYIGKSKPEVWHFISVFYDEEEESMVSREVMIFVNNKQSLLHSAAVQKGSSPPYKPVWKIDGDSAILGYM